MIFETGRVMIGLGALQSVLPLLPILRENRRIACGPIWDLELCDSVCLILGGRRLLSRRARPKCPEKPGCENKFSGIGGTPPNREGIRNVGVIFLRSA